MIKTAVFFDRDGIINDIVMRDEKVSSPRKLQEFQIRSDFEQFYSYVARQTDLLFVVSNQPDIARKLMRSEDLDEMNALLLSRFSFKEILYCLHDDSHACQCRKPKPGMLLSAMSSYGIQADEAIIIGDSYKDILAGQAAGLKTIYRRDSYNASISCEPDFVVTKLMEIVDLPPFRALS